MPRYLPLLFTFVLAACDSSSQRAIGGEPAGGSVPAAGVVAVNRPAPAGIPGDYNAEQVKSAAVGGSTPCERFAAQVDALARQADSDSPAFLRALQAEFVGGTGDPFEMEEGLRAGRWNQAFFYAGSGGFRPEIDDAERYPEGGNHQPGHFVSVLSIAAQYGEENARAALAYAGDYDPGEEDDLRLSTRAIELGTALGSGGLSPRRVAEAVREFCR